jgi:uncharacterized membrane protein YfcA
MDMSIVFVVLGSLAIGITLGLLGSGGSILTVPVLIYLVGHNDKVSIAESLAIVGVISLVGALPYARLRQIDWTSVVYFGIPGMLGTYGGAWLATYVPSSLQLLLFAAVMLLAAGFMIRGATGAAAKERESSRDVVTDQTQPTNHHPWWQITLEGVAVGVLTGLVGVGGGFLIVPALVLLAGLPMRVAVGTSLVVIALKSFSGFFKYLSVLEGLHLSVDWPTIAIFAAIGTVGTLAGASLSQRLNPKHLRLGFSVFLIAMGVFVIIREAPKAFAQNTVVLSINSLQGEK